MKRWTSEIHTVHIERHADRVSVCACVECADMLTNAEKRKREKCTRSSKIITDIAIARARSHFSLRGYGGTMNCPIHVRHVLLCVRARANPYGSAWPCVFLPTCHIINPLIRILLESWFMAASAMVLKWKPVFRSGHRLQLSDKM